jgi:hypothetical protein
MQKSLDTKLKEMTKSMEKNFRRVSEEGKESVLNARKFMLE